MIILAGQSNIQNMADLVKDPAWLNLAKGGSRIRDWLPGTGQTQTYFEDMRPYLAEAEALWWWQGETEAMALGGPHPDAEGWGELFLEIVKYCRSIQPKLPVLMGWTPPIAMDDRTNLLRVYEGQEDLAVRGIVVPVGWAITPTWQDRDHFDEPMLAHMAGQFRTTMAEVRRGER